MINPVLKKEIKTKMRTWKTPALITLYLMILSFFMFFAFIEAVNGNIYRGFRPQFLKETYIIITIIQLILITFIVPATTASSISGEKQRKTFDILLCTRLSSLSIVVGKLAASLVQLFLLLLVSLPVLSILFLFGGISPGNILALFGFFVVTSILFGSIGLFTSAYFRKVATSTIVSYLIALFLVLGTIILTVFFYEVFDVNYNSETIFNILLYSNPFSGLSSILSYQLGNKMLMLGSLLGNPTKSVLMPLYINIVFDIVISVLLIMFTSLKINPLSRINK
ncbi:ABC transporter permease [Caloranaerobacter sp. TR13]|uniref:ABC transporter permease n=1 Tax=Caloranaerobacter sp. TR13 TaxID=1302151 RepID=UPI0006D4767F|nr:ABC transporter permease subunit [Caloranaerobacter sp. TR13]